MSELTVENEQLIRQIAREEYGRKRNKNAIATNKRAIGMALVNRGHFHIRVSGRVVNVFCDEIARLRELTHEG